MKLSYKESLLMTSEGITFYIFAGDDTSIEEVYKTGHEFQTTGLELMKYTLYTIYHIP